MKGLKNSVNSQQNKFPVFHSRHFGKHISQIYTLAKTPLLEQHYGSLESEQFLAIVES
jgi:hypothetical protein